MRRLAWGAVALAALGLTGCGTLLGAGLPKADKLPFTQDALEQFGKRCTGHYWGNAGIAATLGFDISCKPSEGDKPDEKAEPVT